jgi:PAS domain S-box-containing protein
MSNAPKDPASAFRSAKDDRAPVSQQSVRLLIESTIDYAIFSTDLQRKVNYWNSGAERVFGFSEDEMMGRSADIIFTPEDRARGEPERESATALQQGRAEDERWHLRKDGTRFYASGVMAPLRADDDSLQGFMKIARDLTERKLAEDRLRAAREELEARVRERTAELRAANEALRAEIIQREEAEKFRVDVVRRIATAQEDERLRLSRELHDEVGQHLAALMLGLNSLETYLHTTPAAAGILSKLQSLTETIGREIHALAVQLRPTVLDDLGLVHALTNYVEAWSERCGINADFHTSGLEDGRLKPEVEITLYRIVQEALTNVVKHAAATRVSVILNRQNQEVVAVIEDDGRGFDPEAQKTSDRKELGVLGMQERAAQLGGRVTIESSPGRGTTVFARLPVS